MHTRGSRWWPVLLGATIIVLAACQPEPDRTTVVNSFSDSADANPGDGTCADVGGSCTLRAAVMEANALAGTDQILLPAGTYQLDIPGDDENASATGDLDIHGSTYLESTGGIATIDAAGLGDRVLDIRGGTWHVLDGLRLTNGSVVGKGGGIRALSGIVIASVDITANSATSTGGGLANLGAVVALDGSSITANTGSSGGGADNTGLLLASNTTVSGNTGGGIKATDGYVRLLFSTVTDNTGGGLRDEVGRVELMASVVADQATGPDCLVPATSQDYNADSDDTCGLGAAHDQPGIVPTLGPLSAPDPSLFAGHQPTAGSDLIDAVALGAHGCGTDVTIDQFRRVRPINSACDIGAAEVGQLVQTDFCSFDAAVHALAADSTGYYAGGEFTEINDQAGSYTRPGLARCHANGTVDTGFDPALDTNVETLTIDGQWLYVGGDFDVTVSGTRYRRVARIDHATGMLDSSWNPNVVGPVKAIAVHPTGVFVGGNLTAVNGQPATRLVKLDETDGSKITGFAATVDHSNGWENVLALTTHSTGDLLVGGMFESINGTARASAARLDAVTGAVRPFNPVITDTNPNDPKVQVEAILEHQGQIYLCGDWWATEGIGNQADQRNVGRFDGWTGSADLGWLPSVSRGLQACSIDAAGTHLLVAGDHTTVNGADVGATQGLDLTTAAVDPSWLPDPTTIVGVKTIAVTADAVALGGDISAASGTSVGNATRYELG